MSLPEKKGGTAATIIPSVGCPLGCNFCTTSAFFGGKGKFINFYKTGDELFEVMQQMEAASESRLLHDGRKFSAPSAPGAALLERMKEHNKSWGLAVFASANAIRKYTMLELVELGVFMDMDGARISAGDLRKAATDGHPATHARAAQPRHSCSGLNHRRA